MGEMADATMDFGEDDSEYSEYFDAHAEQRAIEHNFWITDCANESLWPIAHEIQRAMPIKDMGTDHLRNSISWLKRHPDYPAHRVFISKMRSEIVRRIKEAEKQEPIPRAGQWKENE